ncbi:transcriptional regulator, TetR family [Lachnospiraceae bacterium NE2001]|nr:transcriptional regulator, TetR family [Lachnospiraceae bacterium NE2001]
MARKVTVSKEVILDSALAMLIRDGYSSINIKSLAAEIGCSTQPIVWHFENMEGLRLALAEYAREYADKKATPKKGNAIEGFEYMGESYVNMAIKEPNLFKFLYLGESPLGKPYELKDISGAKANEEMIKNIAELTGISYEQIARVVKNTIIYSHGIATMLSTGVYKAPKNEIMAMIKNASEAFLLKERTGSNE